MADLVIQSWKPELGPQGTVRLKIRYTENGTQGKHACKPAILASP